jgi:uncharacterized membrane protein
LAVYFSFLLSLIVIDLIWLLGIAKNLYRNDMGSLMASEPKLLAGLGFYLFYALGTSIFVIIPAISKQSWIYAVQYGALFGFFCYMTYDLTNLAVIRDFPVRLALIDIAWGAAVTAISATIAYWVGARVA